MVQPGMPSWLVTNPAAMDGLKDLGVAKKIRELKAILRSAGWREIAGGGKGNHTKWFHPRVPRRVVLAGKDGDDAQRYQERDAIRAVNEVYSE